MRFGILGRLEVTRDGEPISLGGGQQRALLAMLVLERGRVVPVDRLVDALWGEQPPKAAVHTVRVYVSQLRKVLGDAVLVTDDRGYVLQVGAGCLDADRFESLATEARSVAESDNAKACATLREALALWRGAALADFADEPFARHEIARLDELRLGALEALFDLELEAGRGPELVSELEVSAAANPGRERFCAQLMLALYRADRQVDALDAYRRTRDYLDALGIEPGETLRRLQTRILQHDPTLDPDIGPPARQAERGTPGRPRRWWIALGATSAAAVVLVAGVVIHGVSKNPSAVTRDSRIQLVIPGPAPTGRAGPTDVQATIASELAAGGNALRRPGTPVRIVYSGVRGYRRALTTAAQHAGLVVTDPPPAASTVSDIASVARRYPQARFVMIDLTVQLGSFPNNVTGMPFDNAEAGYLAGYLGASEAGNPPIISAVAGDRLLNAEIVAGFRRGARRARHGVHVIVGYSGTFENKAVCAEIANRQINAGSHVVFDVAGNCGFGALDTASIRGEWGVGIDTNLSGLNSHILGSVVLRYTVAVTMAAQLYRDHQLPNDRDVRLALGNDGIVLQINRRVSQAVRQRVATARTALSKREQPLR